MDTTSSEMFAGAIYGQKVTRFLVRQRKKEYQQRTKFPLMLKFF